MSLWTKAALGAAVVAACAGGAQAQFAAAGCTTCGPAGGAGVPNTIPRCNRHSGLTQYPLSEKRYIKQFCYPTIAPGSCFGYHKTQWTAWGDACPQWGHDAVHTPLAAGQPQPANPAAPGTPATGNGIYQPKSPETAPAPAPAAPGTGAPAAPTTDGPPTKPLDLPPAKTPPTKSPLDLPAVPPMPPTGPAPGGAGVPAVPPATGPNNF